MINLYRFKGVVMKGIYLCSGFAFHKNYDILYQDLFVKRDIGGSCLDIDLNVYDYLICTPPCNFWSKARGNRCSQYSLDTKLLLPIMLERFQSCNKPFIIENVCNLKRFKEFHLFDNVICNWYVIGRHIYFTNISFDIVDLNYLYSIQRYDFRCHGKVIKYDDMSSLYHQGGYNVHKVIELFLKKVNGR